MAPRSSGVKRKNRPVVYAANVRHLTAMALWSRVRGMDRCGRAREKVWQAIRDNGGITAVASRIGVHPTHLHKWRRRTKALSERNIALLRAEIPEVDDATWGAALAPGSSAREAQS